MSTMIAAYGSDGECMGRCDAKCYNATCEHCDCICGGMNHGVGVNKATENTRELAESWMKEYEKQHDEKLTFKVMPKPVQLEMFTLESIA